MIYELIDSGEGCKLEKFGPYILSRPCSLALWKKNQKIDIWSNAHMIFSREPENNWTYRKKIPKEWLVEIEDVKIKIAPSDFGHVGLFPEHAFLWKWMKNKIISSKREKIKILNLFAYSGAATIAAAMAGAEVCHLDASRPMIERAKENVKLNNLQKATIRYIVDDAIKFLKRENRRNNFYDGIILDPPTFGRGPKNEVFKIERDINELLSACISVFSKDPLFMILSSHTPGITSIVINHLLKQSFPNMGKIKTNEMFIKSANGFDLPSGFFGIWEM